MAPFSGIGILHNSRGRCSHHRLCEWLVPELCTLQLVQLHPALFSSSLALSTPCSGEEAGLEQLRSSVEGPRQDRDKEGVLFPFSPARSLIPRWHSQVGLLVPKVPAPRVSHQLAGAAPALQQVCLAVTPSSETLCSLPQCAQLSNGGAHSLWSRQYLRVTTSTSNLVSFLWNWGLVSS